MAEMRWLLPLSRTASATLVLHRSAGAAFSTVEIGRLEAMLANVMDALRDDGPSRVDTPEAPDA